MKKAEKVLNRAIALIFGALWASAFIYLAVFISKHQRSLDLELSILSAVVAFMPILTVFNSDDE